MTDFNFKTTDESYPFCCRIRDALVQFCRLSPSDAVEQINSYWHDVDLIDDDPLLFHEPPYYYAMCIAHHPVLGDGQKLWWTDKRWWPPPAGWERD